MRLRQYPIVAKFGIMHLIATNASTWILSILSEVTTDIWMKPRFEKTLVIKPEVNATIMGSSADKLG